ncbi:MAG: chemotaxis protein CheB [Thermodesulfovibrionales bacterium]
MVKVFIVDDSPTFIEAFKKAISSDPEIEVVGYASSGEDAITKITLLKPDVVTMDIIMAGMNGIETTKRILESYPVPIIIVSSCYNQNSVDIMYDAIEAGAVSIMPKPKNLLKGSIESLDIIKTIKLMSHVNVVTRKFKSKDICPKNSPTLYRKDNNIELICIGASTGGPPVLKTILSQLPSDLPVPILVVQHISPGFLDGMISWLQTSCNLNLTIAQDGEMVSSGKVYFAPDNCHMGIDKAKRIFLSQAPPEHCVRPSVSFLFRSALSSFGNRFMGILLTGMGKDGAKELSQLHNLKGITIIQDKESSVVFGMPGEAIRLGAGTFILSPEKIPEQIVHQLYKR